MKVSPTKNKPGRELVDGVMRYDGSGSSGYTGPCSGARITGRGSSRYGRPVRLVAMSSLPKENQHARGGRRSRRERKNQWVPA